MKTRAACVAVALVCAIGIFAAGAAVAAGALGQVVTPGARVDGALVPSGATLFDPASLATTESGAVIHLSSRRALHLAEHSRAVLSSLPSGGVQVAVLAGALSYLDDDGALVTIAEEENAVLDPDPQAGVDAVPGQGKSMESLPYDPTADVVICELLVDDDDEREVCKADPLADECEWKRITVDGSEDPAGIPAVIEQVEYRLGRGDRLRQELNDEYDRDCGDAGALIVLGAAAALGSGTVAGIVVGSVLGAVVISDDLPPASPVLP